MAPISASTVSATRVQPVPRTFRFSTPARSYNRRETPAQTRRPIPFPDRRAVRAGDLALPPVTGSTEEPSRLNGFSLDGRFGILAGSMTCGACGLQMLRASCLVRPRPIVLLYASQLREEVFHARLHYRHREPPSRTAVDDRGRDRRPSAFAPQNDLALGQSRDCPLPSGRNGRPIRPPAGRGGAVQTRERTLMPESRQQVDAWIQVSVPDHDVTEASGENWDGDCWVPCSAEDRDHSGFE